MPRNPGYALTPADVATVSANRALLSNRLGQTVTLDYRKRDGSPSTLTGTVSGFVGSRKGNLSTEAVVIETAKGERSANLWNVKSVS